MDGLKVSVARDGDAFAIVAAGEIDLDNAHHLSEAARLALGARCTAIEIDLSGVDFLDSSGLNELVRIRQECAERHARFALRNVSRAASLVIDAAGLSDMFCLDPPQPRTGYRPGQNT